MAAIDPDTAPEPIAQLLKRVAAPVERSIAARLTGTNLLPGAAPLFEAMRYAALGPGKRLRPALVVAACEASGGTLDQALPAACAVEMLHAYTLVHDDLPAMDDDDMRRGRPTVHKAFNEAIAILAGDALLTAAFAALADLAQGSGDAVRVLAARAGASELLAGQAIDVSGSVPETIEAIEAMHALKTGALFSAAAELGAIAAGNDRQRKNLARYGQFLGIAFQYADDADDGEHSKLAPLMARRRRELAEAAISCLGELSGNQSVLRQLVEWIGTTTP